MDMKRISSEQSKLLGSAIRIQILHLMKEQPRSAKQVADLLGQSPGSVHYHVQKLCEGGLISIERTAQINGITEKFYSANATLFEPEFVMGSSLGRLLTWILFSTEELEQFKSDLLELVQKWEARQSAVSMKDRKEILVQFQLNQAPKLNQTNATGASIAEVSRGDAN